MGENVFGETVEIRGREYGGANLWTYLEEYKDEFTEQAVLKEIAEEQAEEKKKYASNRKINREFTAVEDNPFLFHGKKEIYQGNALFMAIHFKKYELARKWIEQQGFIKDGSCVPVYCMENAEPLIMSRQPVNLLTLLLEDEEMPEELWMKVWGFYSQNYTMALQVFQAPQAKIKLWMSTLKKIKVNRPDFFGKIVNERFLLEFLWCYAMGYKWESQKDVKQFCREWKKWLPAPKNMTMCQQFLLKELSSIPSTPDGKEDEMARIFCFADLWKRVSAQNLVIDFSKPEMDILNFTHRNKYDEEILDALLKMADEIKHAEHAEWNGIFRCTAQKKERFKMALEKNLITESMVPTALEYLRKSTHPELIAFLFLKQHGEL